MTRFVTDPVARKEYRCAMGGDTIKPGERYTREAHAPWTFVQDDPDGGGEPLGEWDVQRYHGKCWADAMYGGSQDPWAPEGGYPAVDLF